MENAEVKEEIGLNDNPFMKFECDNKLSPSQLSDIIEQAGAIQDSTHV